MAEKNAENQKRKPTNLEMVNEMYKAAFIMKKERFAKDYPNLSERELYEFTLAYFKGLHGVKYDRPD